MVVRAESRRRGNRVARHRRGRGRRRGGDELLQDAAGRHSDAPRDPRERRHRRALPRSGRVLDLAGRERGGRGRLWLAAHRHVSRTRSRTRSSSAGSAGSTCRGCGCGLGRSGSPGSRATRSAAPASMVVCATRIPRRAPRTGSRFVPSSASEPTWTHWVRALRPATAITSRGTRRTSTGVTSTRRATTAASAPTAERSSRASRSSVIRSSTASPPGSSPTSSLLRRDGLAVRALVSRAVAEVKGGADALVLLPPPSSSQRRSLVGAGFAPTNKKLRFIGKPLHDSVRVDDRARAWHFTLGDFDFF